MKTKNSMSLWVNSRKYLNYSVKFRKVLLFKVLVSHFLIENVWRSKYNLPRFQEENLKLVVDKGRVMWEPKVYLITQSAWKESKTWNKLLTWTSCLQRKQVGQWSVIQSILQKQNQNLRIYSNKTVRKYNQDML